MTSIGPLTTLPYSAQTVDRPQDQSRPVPPERPGDEGGNRPKVARFRERLQNQAERLRNAIENGDIDPARARDIRECIIDGRERLHDRVIDRPTDRPTDRPRPDGDDQRIDPARVREHLQNVKARLKNAIENGILQATLKMLEVLANARRVNRPITSIAALTNAQRLLRPRELFLINLTGALR